MFRGKFQGDVQGEVPGHDAPYHPQGFPEGVVQKGTRHRDRLAVDLVGHSGKVPEVLHHRGHVDLSGLEIRLSVVPGLQGGQLVGVLLDEIGEAPKELRAPVGVHLAPLG